MTSYTAAQTEAISCVDQTLQIIACAGSGKTQVISQRIARILALPDTKPHNIIAFTFTEKAAAELKERVTSIIQKELGNIDGLAEMYIGTMHGYCLDLLQRLVPEKFKFSVLSDVTAQLLVDRFSKASGLTTCPTSAAKGHLKRFVDSRLFLQVVSVLREDNIDASKIPDGVKDSFSKYMTLLQERSLFDYTQIIRSAVDYLDGDRFEDDDIARVQDHIKNDIRYLVVDEYQDVNPLQERLIKSLIRYDANLCVVGDDDQTIYQWRGSQVSNIITFAQRYSNVRQITLDNNFRSSRGIVEVGRSIANMIPAGERLQKEMVAGGHQEWERGDLLTLSFESPESEAHWIADRIEHLRGMPFQDRPDSTPRGLSWSDCAVLFRSVAKDSGPLVSELARRNIPFIVKGLNRLFDSPEVQACVGIFRYMVNETDGVRLHELWSAAFLIPNESQWLAAVELLDQGKKFDEDQRYSLYNIQRLYLNFLEALEIREGSLPGDKTRQELLFYQLGKFSQIISDYEQIHYSSAPRSKYEGFANWLQYQAPSYYADVDSDVGYAAPDAVIIATVHQSKGLQWPSVFLPAMRQNRFPSKVMGGVTLKHIIPDDAIEDPARYRGTLEDEIRLLYVAATRSQKFLYMTFSPVPGNQQQKTRSIFFIHLAQQQWVSTNDSPILNARISSQPLQVVPKVALSFSELKYLFECAYQFKLRFLYGFNAPIHEALGFGKGLHDALAEVHKRAIDGDILSKTVAAALIDRHLHVPFAYPALKANLRKVGIEAIERYFDAHGGDLAKTEFSEKPIQVSVAPGITVDGRIDLIRRLDSGETSIVDFKSTDRSQPEDVTRDQLHVYALGYKELTGNSADLIEVLNLDERGKTTRETINEPLLRAVCEKIKSAGDLLRANVFPRLQEWDEGTCGSCDVSGICRSRPRNP